MEDPWLVSTLAAFKVLGLMGKELREARWQALEVSRRAADSGRLLCVRPMGPASSSDSDVEHNALHEQAKLVAYDEGLVQVALMAGQTDMPIG